MTGPEISSRDLRVSDAEREHALNLLERATGRGLIDITEFAGRSGKVVAAKTRADLNALLIDLPGLQLAGRSYSPEPPANWSSARPEPAAPTGWPAPAMAGWMAAAPGEVLELKGYGSRQFTGRWVVPSLIVVTGVGAGTKLDFTQARLTSHIVTIEFRSNLGGSMHLRVPAGTVVRYDGLDLRGCSLHNGLVPFNGPPPLLLNLVGIKRYGSIHIRQPKKSGLQRLLSGFADTGR